jgi:hypothetical protein
MYGGHPTSRGSPPHTARACGCSGIRRTDSLQSSIGKPGSSRERTKLHRPDPGPPERMPRVPPLKALHTLCGINAENAHRSPTEAHLDAGSHPRVNTIKSQFRGLVQVRESNPRHAVTKPLLYPTELTCGGMKQSGRAVRACATRSGAQARQVGFTNPLSLHDRCFDLVTRPGNMRSQILPLVLTHDFSSPKTTKPRSAVPSGVSWRECSGDHRLVSPATQANRANASRFPRRAEVRRRES